MDSSTVNVPSEKIVRRFLPIKLNIDDWTALEPFFSQLVERKNETPEQLLKWLYDLSELEAIIEEHAGWLYIRMTCDTQDKKLTEAYTFFVEEISPKIAPYTDKINKKFIAEKQLHSLDAQYGNHIKSVENSIKLFREENIPLHSQLSVKEQQYGEIAGAMTVDVNGKTLTLQQAANFLKEPDRELRNKVYHLVVERRSQDRTRLDNLFNELISLRTTIAKNAGFDNYRDYKFVELDRFDYTAADCISFHSSVRDCIVPVLNDFMKDRKDKLKVASLKPYDLEVDPEGKKDLKPFEKGTEMLDMSIACFSEIDSYFGHVLNTLKTKGYTDLDSRIGKAPGGYNYPLYESGVPFIFMNASGSLRDVITMVHEGGHAIHSMLTADLEFIGFKELPSEVAELASMSMELISMEHWNHFFKNEDDLKRAKREQLENVIEALPWIACIDAFQHWIYLNPNHSIDERTNQWKKLILDFTSSEVDWSEDQKALEAMWQKQLHLFEVPFYYIEYGMAQLGAIAVWRNYKKNPVQAIQQYKDALQLGYTKSIPEVYLAAGIRFDFSENYIHELVEFVREELKKL